MDERRPYQQQENGGKWSDGEKCTDCKGERLNANQSECSFSMELKKRNISHFHIVLELTPDRNYSTFLNNLQLPRNAYESVASMRLYQK